jgi:hypothetical protein
MNAMGKQRTWEQLQSEMEQIHKEMEALRAERLKELEKQANEIGYTLTPVGQTARKTARAKSKPDREAMRVWLEAALKAGPMAKGDLQKSFREKFEGNRLRLDGWADTLKVDAKGNVSLK